MCLYLETCVCARVYVLWVRFKVNEMLTKEKLFCMTLMVLIKTGSSLKLMKISKCLTIFFFFCKNSYWELRKRIVWEFIDVKSLQNTLGKLRKNFRFHIMTLVCLDSGSKIDVWIYFSISVVVFLSLQFLNHYL